MRFVRTVLAALVIIVALAAVAAALLGNAVDRDRDNSLAGLPPNNTADATTPTVTILPPETTLTRATVERVSDGDTIRVRIENTVETLRLVGIDAPETATDFPSDCYAIDARDYLTRLVNGKTVYLERDANDRDQYGRLLRYVWLPKGDGYLLVNQLLVGRGYAAARIYGQDSKHAEVLARTERAAITSSVGMWGACVTANGQGVAGAPGNWNGRSDLDCRDFATRVNAQAFYAEQGGPGRDPHNLDVDMNGLVCQTRRPSEPLP
jgi:micrococcal nuclease